MLVQGFLPWKIGWETLLWAASGPMGLKNDNNIDKKLTGFQSFCGTVGHVTVKMLKAYLTKMYSNSHTHA
jgi:hypothetical protein